ncbi:MAG TPA: ABC transporter substrate-binding protein, partial [Acidimicrobiales bacterium]|nr:ABC transporter substrate-binding protein [Acidimicrobiales bacterium]
MSRRRPRPALVAALAVLALVGAACSSRGEDSTAPEASDTTAAADDAGAAEVTFGDLPSPCGPAAETDADATTTTEGSSSGAGTPEGDTQGITDDAILVGTVADPGFSGTPGLNQEIFDAGDAFTAWCNEQGGINGRRIELTKYDAAISNYQSKMLEACGQEFAIVGDGAVQDNLWASTGAECGLIDVAGFAVTPEKSGTVGPDVVAESRVVQPVPNTADTYEVGGLQTLAEENPEAFQNVGILYGDFDTLRVQADKGRQAIEAEGGTVVSELTYNLTGEANWAPIAQALEADGVQWLYFVGQPGNLAALQQSMVEIDWRPEVTFVEANHYDPAYLEAAGDAAEGTYVRAVYVPFEEADQNPATQDYLDMVAEVDGKTALLGAQSVSAWLLFAEAARQCDRAGDLTRTCVLDTAGSVTEWTG